MGISEDLTDWKTCLEQLQRCNANQSAIEAPAGRLRQCTESLCSHLRNRDQISEAGALASGVGKVAQILRQPGLSTIHNQVSSCLHQISVEACHAIDANRQGPFITEFVQTMMALLLESDSPMLLASDAQKLLTSELLRKASGMSGKDMLTLRGQLVTGLTCVSMDSLHGSHHNPAISIDQVLAVANVLARSVCQLTSSRSFLTRTSTSRVSHIVCALRAIARLAHLTSSSSQAGPVPKLAIPKAESQEWKLSEAMSTCLQTAVDAVLDPMESLLAGASRKGAELQRHMMATSCIILHAAADGMAMLCVHGGAAVRSRLRGLLTTVAKQASAMLGLPTHVDPVQHDPQQPDTAWGWDCRTSKLTRSIDEQSSTETVASQLCQQLCMILANCAVSQRPAASIALPFALVPSHKTGTSFCEHIAAMLCMGHMATFAQSASSSVAEAVATAIMPVLTLALSNLVASPSSPAYSPSAYACILETMARSVPPLVHCGVTWVYNRASSILLRAYHSPDSPPASFLLYHNTDTGVKRGPEAGALARALEAIGNGAASLPPPLRTDFSRRLLSLFADFTMASKPSSPHKAPPLDSVALLPALAGACEAAHLDHSSAAEAPSTSRTSTPTASAQTTIPASQQSSSSSFVLSKIDELRATDAPTVKLFRNVWLYCGLLQLRASPVPAYLAGWPPASHCLAALGRLAAATPVLMYGTGTAKQKEAEQRVLLELKPHLAAVGGMGTPPAVLESLNALLADSPAVAVQSPSNPFLLAVAALEMSRAEIGPISLDDDVPMPIMHALAYEAGSLPDSMDRSVFISLAQSSFQSLTQRLTKPASAEKKCFLKLERLACTIINAVASQNRKQIKDLPQSGVHLDGMLNHLLGKAPFLFYSPKCLEAWLTHESNPLLLSRIQLWLKRAAARAPTHMEHLLQRFMVSVAAPITSHVRLLPDLVCSTKLLDAIAAGRAQSQLESVTEVGLMALHQKGAARGRVQAIQELVPGTEAEIAKRVTAEAGHIAPWGDDEKKLCLAAAAFATSSVVIDSRVPESIVFALCFLPLKRFTGAAMHDVAFAWHWMAAEAPIAREAVLQGVEEAWQQAADSNLGLFSGQWIRKHVPLTSGDLEGWNVNSGSEAVVSALHAHHVWLICLLELWECSRHAVAMDAGDAHGTHPVMAVFCSVLKQAVSRREQLSTHPLARAPLFRLLSLAMRILRHVAKYSLVDQPSAKASALLDGDSIASLLQETVQLGLKCFEKASDVPVMDVGTGLGLAEITHALAAFEVDSQELQREAPEACSAAKPMFETLRMLVADELALHRVLLSPLETVQSPDPPPDSKVASAVEAAWHFSPALAYAVASRFHRCPLAGQKLRQLTMDNSSDQRTLAWAQGAPEYAKACRESGTKPVFLEQWAPLSLSDSLAMLTHPYRDVTEVRHYVMRCLAKASDDDLVFWLPQVVQQLRGDKDGALRRFLLVTATDSSRWMLLHKLVWALETEERPSDSEFNPEVKRSGWQPPCDSGLWTPCQELKQDVLQHLPANAKSYFEAEHGTFQQVTDISGILKPVPKEKRRDAIAAEARKIVVPRDDLYLPVDVHKRLVAVVPDSGRAMQSAAKTPVLLAFEVEVLPMEAHTVQPFQGPVTRQACIFKVGDDCRQDVLALQIITLLRNAFKCAGLPLYLNPYGVLPTGYERGIIEVVPDTKSRAGMGELTDVGLYEIFQSRYGAPGTPSFEAARRQFILSEAGYAVASYILQSKDRHNGNILVDSTGRIVHIDFGFIFEISPGGNLGFETAAFKFSYEMVQLIDPGGHKRSAEYQEFKELCVKGFMAARAVAEDIMVVAALMAESGLPCYGRGRPLEHLRERFMLRATPQEAAAFMRTAVDAAYNRWTTGFYDYIQILQNDIPF